jgi:hypothetical protein
MNINLSSIFFSILFKILSHGEISIKFTENIILSDIFSFIGFKEIHFKNINPLEYKLLYIFIPGTPLRLSKKNGINIKKSDLNNFDSKVIVTNNNLITNYIEGNQGPFVYIFYTNNSFHPNRYLIYSLRLSFMIKFYIFKVLYF